LLRARLDDLHGISPNLCTAVTIFVDFSQVNCHCVFIYSNFSRNQWRTWGLGGFPRRGVIFGSPTQTVRGCIDGKSELGARRRRKFTRTPHDAYNCFYTLLKSLYNCDVTEMTSRPLNLANSRVKLFPLWSFDIRTFEHSNVQVTIEHSKRCIATLQIAEIHANCRNSWKKIQN